MRVTGSTVQKLLLGLALLSALAWNLAHATEIKDLTLSTGATGTRAEIALGQPADFRIIRLNGPERLVVDLPASRFSRGLTLPAGRGVVKSVRRGEPSPGVARIVFDLAQPVAVLNPRIEQGANGPHMVLEWPGDGEAAPVAMATATPSPSESAGSSAPSHATASPAPNAAQDDIASAAAANAATTRLISELAARPDIKSFSPSQSAQSPATPADPALSSPAAAGIASAGMEPAPDAVKSMKDILRSRGMRPLVIAIDAGHGGQDPGATGPSGKREKDVVLAISRELARQINATPGMRAFLVRDTDVYVERTQRARRARAAKADMFVSIHADAATNRTARGSSVFTLSTRGASSQYARWAADRENASDLVGGVRLEQGTLSSVLLDLAQTGHMKASQDAARLVLDGLRQVGRNHKPHVEYANFEVLRNADMPAMLVETGFISNPEEERRLSDTAYQKRLARAVLEGVNTYFLRQPPPGTLYAARAAAESTPTAMTGGGGSP